MLMHGAVENAANLSDFHTFSRIELNGINTYMYKHWFLHLLDWVVCEVRPTVSSACKDNKFVEI